MGQPDIAGNYDTIKAATTLFLKNYGALFTGPAEGHVQTYVAAAASVSGLMLLREAISSLDDLTPGTTVLIELEDRYDAMLDFMKSALYSYDLEYEEGWLTPIPDDDQPLLSVLEMTHKLEQPLLDACTAAKTPKEFYPHVAALTAIKLINMGINQNLLDLDIGKALAVYYLALGSKTVPYPLSATD